MPVYTCNMLVVAMQVPSGQQRFFLGHTSNITALALPESQRILVSAQAQALKVWNFAKGTCLHTM